MAPPDSRPDVRGRVARREADLVGTGGAIGLLAEVDEEPLIEFHPPGILIAIDEQNVRALLRNLGIKLIVPLAEQRIRDVEATAVEAELQHLRPARQSFAVDRRLLAEQP